MVSNLLSLFQKLAKAGCVSHKLGGETYAFELTRKGVLQMTTTVFHSEGYLPPSIAEAVENVGKGRELPEGYKLHLEADDHLVTLSFNTSKPNQDFSTFRDQLNEFFHVADDWRERLNGYGRQDLVYVELS